MQNLDSMRSGDTSNLEQRLARLESVIKIGSDGVLTIECAKVRIKGGTSVEIASGATVSIKCGANVQIQASANLTLKSSGTVDVLGSLLRLNNGSRPIARGGDLAMTTTGPATIIATSTSVLG